MITHCGKSWHFFRIVFTTLWRFLEVPKHSDASLPQPNGGHSSRSRCPHRVNLVSVFELPHGEARTCPDSRVFGCIPSVVAVAVHPGLKTCIGKDMLKLRWNYYLKTILFTKQGTPNSMVPASCGGLIYQNYHPLFHGNLRGQPFYGTSGLIKGLLTIIVPTGVATLRLPWLLNHLVGMQSLKANWQHHFQVCWPLARVGSTWRSRKTNWIQYSRKHIFTSFQNMCIYKNGYTHIYIYIHMQIWF